MITSKGGGMMQVFKIQDAVKLYSALKKTYEREDNKIQKMQEKIDREMKEASLTTKPSGRPQGPKRNLKIHRDRPNS
ncbi:hypothetical protein [Lacticaseibacillus paracasei]|nr:hypothetical protein [Lacticaseibacillus paracasei]